MDGTHREVIVKDRINWPNGLAVDVDTQRIYWCDAKTDMIETAAADGSDRRVLIRDQLPHPFGFTILGDYIYWTDWLEKTVERARKDTGEERFILLAHLEDQELMGVFASSTEPNPNWHNQCSSDNGGCSHLCLATPEGRTCDCPDAGGYELGADGVTCVVPEAFILYTKKSTVGRLSLQPGMRNDYSLPLTGVSEAAALDFDRSDGQIYWSDIDAKTISRSYLNGSDAEVVVQYGLDFPEGVAVDWNSGNLYWTDMALGRIEVSRTDGSSRRTLIWTDLSKPASIVLNPGNGDMYWSSWGETPLIEQASLDGSARTVFRDDVGRTNGLTIDFGTSRMYWADLDASSIYYTYLQRDQPSKVVLSNLMRPYSLTIFKNFIYWVDWEEASVFRADKDSGKDKKVIEANISNVMDLMVYKDSLQSGSNSCKFNNGGCSNLCFYVDGKSKCGCPSHFKLSQDESRCLPPRDFILFSQKNKISRLVSEENSADDSDVPDLILPIHGARDVRALSFDPASELIYWIDYGSKRTRDFGGGRFSIKRAFMNGTLQGRRLQGGVDEDGFEPLDLAVDPVNRLIFWVNKPTGSINVTRIVDDDDDGFSAVIGGSDEEPTKIAIHYQKR